METVTLYAGLLAENVTSSNYDHVTSLEAENVTSLDYENETLLYYDYYYEYYETCAGDTPDNKTRRIVLIFREIVQPTICLIGLIGNILNIIALKVLKSKFGGSVLEKFYYDMLLVLAVADMGFCIFWLPWLFISLNNQDFDLEGVAKHSFTSFYLQYNDSIAQFWLCCSTFVTTAVSMVRFASVIRPITTRMNMGSTLSIKITILVVVLSIAVNVPRLFLYDTYLFDEELKRYCVYWLEDTRFFYAYLQVSMVVTFALPVIVLVICTIGVLYHLHKMKRISTFDNDSVQQTNRNVNKTSRVMKIMLIAIAIEYIICALPARIIPFLEKYMNYTLMVEITNAIEMSNYATNFILYSLLNAKFRRVFLGKPCCRLESASRGYYSQTSTRSTLSTRVISSQQGQLLFDQK